MTLSAATVAALGLAAVVAATMYISRDPWFSRYGDPGWVFLAGLAVALTGGYATASLLLPRRLWNLTRVGVPVAMLVLSILGAGSAWGRSMPSTKGLKAAIKSDDTPRIESEAHALRALQINEQAGAEALDMLHLSKLKAARNAEAMAKIAEERWYVVGAEARALTALLPTARREMTALVAANDSDGLVRLAGAVRPLDADFGKEVAAHLSYVRGVACADRRDCECVKKQLKQSADLGLPKESRAKLTAKGSSSFASAYSSEIATSTNTVDPYRRQKALRGAIEYAKCYEHIALRQPDPPISTVEKTLKKVDADVDVADRRAAFERRQREAAEANEERARRAREAASSGRGQSTGGGGGLMCRDGTLSPKCTCGGPRRGCCSHHGGVQGCE